MGIIALLLGLGLEFSVPLQIANANGLDESWRAVLHYAFGQGLAFGRDLVFTYGPLGFLTEPRYYPATFPLPQLFGVLRVILIWAATFKLAGGKFGNPYVFAAWQFLIFIFAPRWIVGPLLLLSLAFSPDPSRRGFLYYATLAFCTAISLAKINYLFITLALVLFLEIRDILTTRRISYTLPAFISFLLLLWLATGQHPADLYSYIRNAIELCIGYADAMGMINDEGLLEPLGFILIFAAQLLWIFPATSHLPAQWRWPYLAALFVIGWLEFKILFIRQRGRQLAGVNFILLVACMHIPWLLRERITKGRMILIAACFAALLPYAEFLSRRHVGHGFLAQLPQSFVEAGAGLANLGDLAFHGRKRLDLAFRREQERLRAGMALPSLAGTVDIYRQAGGIAVLLGLDYCPRPVFQSYTAYTPALAEINAKHLRGPKAPDFILFYMDTIDGRYPSLDDAKSWPELFSRYRPAGKAACFLLLRKSDRPRPIKIREISRRELTWSDSVPVPDYGGALIWAEIDIKPSPIGRILALVYKPAPVVISIMTDEWDWVFSLPIRMAQMGFLLSPLVLTANEFSGLFNPPDGVVWKGRKVKSLSVFCPHAAEFYEPSISLRLYSLSVKE